MRPLTLGLAAALLPLFLLSHNVRAEDPEAVSPEFLRKAYLVNRDKFRSFSCTFDLARGSAASQEAALAGKLSDVVRQRGAWKVDADEQLFELVCLNKKDEALPPIPPKSENPRPGAFISTRCASKQILANHRLTVMRYSLLSSPSLVGEFGRFVPITHTPIAMGAMGNNESLGPGIHNNIVTKAGTSTSDFDGFQDTTDGKRVPTLRITTSRGPKDGSYTQFFLDPDYDYLPVEVRYFHLDNDQERMRVIVTKVRKAANGGYISDHVVEMNVSIRPLKVTILDLDELNMAQPKASEMQMRVTDGQKLSIRKPEGLLPSVRVKGDTAFTLAQLEEIYNNAAP
jgi:hypothetical protein